MTARRNIKMTFICDQNWDAMKATANGRYCDICKKEVFDFTSKSADQINKLDKGVCGIFLPEHVEENITPIKLNFIKKTKYYIATIATLVGLESQLLKAQNQGGQKPKTEIIENRKDIHQSDSSALDTTDEDDVVTEDLYADKKSFMRIGRRSFYWSRRFPFIVTRRRHWMGAKF